MSAWPANSASARAGSRLAVLQHQPSAMVLHDLLDDGKAKAGSLRLVRHIGLRQPGAFLALRQAHAVILDHKGEAVLDRLQANGDSPALPLWPRPGGDGVGACG